MDKGFQFRKASVPSTTVASYFNSMQLMHMSTLKDADNNQRRLRVELYSGLADHLNSRAEERDLQPGVPVVLPSSFLGSPQAMQQNYQDAEFRPDLLTRVFKLHLIELLKDIKDRHVLGVPVAHVQV